MELLEADCRVNHVTPRQILARDCTSRPRSEGIVANTGQGARLAINLVRVFRFKEDWSASQPMWASGRPPSRIRISSNHSHQSPRSPGRYRLPLADIDEGGFWDSVPAAPLLAVFRCLDSRDVAAACCVCAHWKDVGSSRSLWKELLVREYK